MLISALGDDFIAIVPVVVTVAHLLAVKLRVVPDIDALVSFILLPEIKPQEAFAV